MRTRYDPLAPITHNDAKVIEQALNNYAGDLISRTRTIVRELAVANAETADIDAAVRNDRAHLADVQRVVEQFTVSPSNYLNTFDQVVNLNRDAT